jgi:DNA-binding response OmpR family regulator
MTILLVDDSRFLRTANERALAKAGHTVITAGDGEEGLRMASQHRPDLVILDLMLPKLSGVDLLRAIRKDPATAETPVMILSSLSQRNEEKLVSEGATAYFEKAMLETSNGTRPFLSAVEELLRANRRKAASH